MALAKGNRVRHRANGKEGEVTKVDKVTTHIKMDKGGATVKVFNHTVETHYEKLPKAT